ncbi:MAG: Pr6Pr family membrane protein [Rhodoglobus sp.]
MRVASGTAVVAILIYAYVLRLDAGDANPFDYFGYFTNQTSLIASATLIATGVFTLTGRQAPLALTTLRALATSYLLVVAVIYNLLVPGTGSAPPWVSVILHVAFPLLVALDWAMIGDRARLRWGHLWLLMPYPVLWLAVVLTRGATDGWVPYGFLLPERGIASLLIHIVGLLATVMVAGVLVWGASRLPGLRLSR